MSGASSCKHALLEWSVWYRDAKWSWWLTYFIPSSFTIIYTSNYSCIIDKWILAQWLRLLILRLSFDNWDKNISFFYWQLNIYSCKVYKNKKLLFLYLFNWWRLRYMLFLIIECLFSDMFTCRLLILFWYLFKFL